MSVRMPDDGRVFSVEATLDPALESAVLADWAALIDAELPSAGRHSSASNRPHVTLAVRGVVDPAALAGVERALPFAIELGGIVLFPGSRGIVVARLVVMSAPLMALHAEVATRVGEAEPAYANTAPDRWTPHVTLARRVAPAQLPAAFERIASAPPTGAVTGLRVWDAAAKRITTLR